MTGRGPAEPIAHRVGPEEYEARLAAELAADLIRQAVLGCSQNESRHPDASVLVRWANQVAKEWAETRHAKIQQARERDAEWRSQQQSKPIIGTDLSPYDTSEDALRR
jgi:hypothetical protein